MGARSGVSVAVMALFHGLRYGLLRRWRGVRLPYALALEGQSEAERLNYRAPPPNLGQSSNLLRHHWPQRDALQQAGATKWELLEFIRR